MNDGLHLSGLGVRGGEDWGWRGMGGWMDGCLGEVGGRGGRGVSGGLTWMVDEG